MLDIIIGLFLVGLLVFYVRRRGRGISRPTYSPQSWQSSSPTTNARLSALQASSVTVKKPINKEAYRILLKIEKILTSDAPKARVLAEVGMGAFLSTAGGGDLLPEDKLAFSSFNAKRVDFLIIDGFGQPAFIVEYQGSGHHMGGTAGERDMLKREAIRQARIELVEIFDHHSDVEIYSLLHGAVQRNCGRILTAKAQAAENGGVVPE